MRTLIRSLAVFLMIVVAAACDRSNNASPVASPSTDPQVSPDGRIHLHEANAKGWSPVLFKEPIQGRKLGDNKCAWPGSGKIAQKHPRLTYTVGEYDPATCAGVIYFGDWAADIKRMTDKAPARADTTFAPPPQFKAPQAFMENPACDYLGATPGTTRYRSSTQWVASYNSEPQIQTRVEYTAIVREYGDGWWCQSGESGYTIRNYWDVWYAYGNATSYFWGDVFSIAGGQVVNPNSYWDLGGVFTNYATAQRACSGYPNTIVDMAFNDGDGWPQVKVSYPSGYLGGFVDTPPSSYSCPISYKPLAWYITARGATEGLSYP